MTKAAVLVFSLFLCFFWINRAEAQQPASGTDFQQLRSGAHAAKFDPLTGVPDPEMVLVDSGSFIMGCTIVNDNPADRLKDCGEDERPVHLVTLGAYRIGKFEITQEEWRAVMGNNPSYHTGCDNCPVENVSWNEIQEFIRRLNEKSHRRYSLPTEAQWEYAARGGNKGKGYRYAGSDTIYLVAWWGDKVIHTSPVGLKRANELGISDMSGNVWEWCSDWFGVYPVAAQSNPPGPVSGDARVIRGGSTRHEEIVPRVFTRSKAGPDERFNGTGFRLALTP